MDGKYRKKVRNPYVEAGIFSKLFICWISPLLSLGHKRELTENDLASPCPKHEMEYLTEKLEKEWDKELTGNAPNLTRAFLRAFSWEMFVLFILMSFLEMLKFVTPLLIIGLIKYFDGTNDLETTLIYAGLMSLNIIIGSLIHHPFYMLAFRFGQSLRVACSGLIYKKIVKLKLLSEDGSKNSQILNLLANDAGRLEGLGLFFPNLIIGPVQGAFIVWILVKEIDPTILCGLVVPLVAIPVQLALGKVFDRLRLIALGKSDKRIDFLGEIFSGIKIIKMYCWERSFSVIVDALRKRELDFQAYIYMVTGFNFLIDLVLPSLITYASVSFFLYFSNTPLQPSYIVLAMSYYSRLSLCLGYNFVKATTDCISASVSFRRMKEFLTREEIKQSNNLTRVRLSSLRVTDMTAVVSIGGETTFELKDISFEARHNELIAIVGPTGSGKSSLLLALLDELDIVKGKVEMNGKVFYVSQEPWIFNASIKQNILFGVPYDETKFKEIVRVACLEQDLELFEHGANTMIGERGSNLSGGQRARIGVARALYSDAQIYLFDDPLSAIDATVGKKLFDNCFNQFLKSKIRILVTHQIHLLTKVKRIFYMSDGQIKFKGSYADLVRNGLDLAMSNHQELLTQNNDEPPASASAGVANNRRGSHRPSMALVDTSDLKPTSSRRQSIDFGRAMSFAGGSFLLNQLDLLYPDFDDDDDDNASAADADGDSAAKKQSAFDESQQYGLLSWKTYLTYFKLGSGVAGTLLTFLVFVVAQLLIVYADYWLSNWSSLEHSEMKLRQEAHNMTRLNETSSSLGSALVDKAERAINYQMYSALVALAVLAGCLRNVLFFRTSVNASRSLHSRMFASLLGSRVRFFDLNPLGRIMNRFSKDMSVLDEAIPLTVYDFMHSAMLVIGPLCVVVYLNQWMLIALLVVLAVFLAIRKYCMVSLMQLKRIESKNRSPIYVHVSNTISGLVTIRAAVRQDHLIKEFFVHCDYHSRAVHSFLDVTRWFGVRLDWVTILFTIVSIFSFVFLNDYLDINSGQMGIMLVYTCQSINLVQWGIRQSCEVENLMTSVERVLEYVRIPREENSEEKLKCIASKEWPSRGEIVFENVSFKYDVNLPYTLEEISVKINAGEKVGIVGKTGSGKSTIIQTLFRMAEPDGNILIDQINIKDVDLNILRSKLSIIPQEPILFIGTIRSNLDPFNEHPDEELWKALEQVQLKESIKEMNNGLDSEVQRGGSNLSVGQKQLICLARAIIKKSKILVIDEATANVDFKTDALVQQAIRECFAQCTVLTIAHRLHTIIDNHRIMCLNKGRVENFGRPIDLIRDESSILHDLVYSLSAEEASELVAMAAKTSIKKKESYTANRSITRKEFLEAIPDENENEQLLPKLLDSEIKL